MKKIIIIILLLFFTIIIKSQNFMEISFVKEIIYNDTCIRFYNVSNFNIEDTNVWYKIAENLYNIVLITPMKREKGDKNNNPEYYSSCEKVIFYCIDDNIDTVLLSVDNLLNKEALKRKIICKHYYNTPRDLIIDPFNYGFYSKKKNKNVSNPIKSEKTK